MQAARREDRVPGAKRLIGGDQSGSALVAGADQFEQDGGFGLAFVDVGEVVEGWWQVTTNQVVFVELGDGEVKKGVFDGMFR